jgi:hypothetical protein
MNRILLAALLGTASAAGLFAQAANPAIIDRVQQPGAPDTPDAATAAKAKDEKGDLDGGTQRLAETRKLPFKLIAAYDLQIFGTSNVFLQASDPVEALVVANTLQTRAEFNGIVIGQGLLTPSAGVAYQRYHHALGSGDQARENLDFDAYSLPLALRLRYANNWEFGLGVTGTAVYSHEPSYDLTYKAVTTALTVRKLISIDRNQLLSFGAGVNFVITDAESPAAPFGYRSDRNDKTDTYFDAAYYYLKDRWVFSPYARFTYSDFSHYQEAGFADVDRRDRTLSVGASASYTLNPWATARIFTSADWRDSLSDNGVDYGYKSANFGLGLTLSATF